MFGGIKFKNMRGICSVDKIEILPQQKIVKIDASQSNVIVKVGSTVKKGTLLAEGKNCSPNVFSSISGTIKDINNKIVIENNYKNEEEKLPKLNNPSSKQIIDRIKDAGIVGLGGSGFCTHLKYSTKNKINTLLINAIECENYLSCDEAVLKLHTKEVFEGIKLLTKASGANRVILCLQKRNKKYLFTIKKYLDDYNCEICFVTNKYAVGAEKILIKEVLKIDVAENELPINRGILVNNLHTAWAVYRACKLGLPLTERVVSVTGLSIKNPANYLIPNGATVENICKDAGGLKYDYVQMEDYKYSAIIILQSIEGLRDKIRCCENVEEKQSLREKLNIERLKLKTEIKAVRKEKLKQYRLCLSRILLGGFFMGNDIDDLEDAVKITDGGVLFLSNLEFKRKDAKRCINCKKCVKVCPKKLRPELLNKYIENLENTEIEKEKTLCVEQIEKLNINRCFNCGCCSFVCPSKIKLRDKFKNYKDNKK